jgi:hypothetical protein
VNVIAYYSTTIFIESGYSRTSALLASMGTGILNCELLYSSKAYIGVAPK